MPYTPTVICGARAYIGPLDLGAGLGRHILVCSRAKHRRGMHSTRWSEELTNDLGFVIGALVHQARWAGTAEEIQDLSREAKAAASA